jgi:hypothetical protein
MFTSGVPVMADGGSGYAQGAAKQLGVSSQQLIILKNYILFSLVSIITIKEAFFSKTTPGLITGWL